jgi:Glucodextranase, domain B
MHLAGKEKATTTKTFFKSKSYITPARISVAVACLFLAVFFGYIFWEVVSIHSTPNLAVASPQDGEHVTESHINVKGKTDVGSELFINDHKILVSETGDFESTVSLTPGERDINFLARNKFNKVVEKKVSLIVDIPQAENYSGPAVLGDQTLKLKVSALSDFILSYKIEGESQPDVIMRKGDEKFINGKMISVSSTDGGAAKISTDKGVELGLLGKAGQPIKDVVFNSEALNFEVLKK